MPELPEVETTVRALRQPLVGRTIVGMENRWTNQIGQPTLDEFQVRISGCRVEAIDRRAKYLIFRLTQGENLVIHLKMTGFLNVVDATETKSKHVHTTFFLDNGQELRFRDTRKFGRVYLVEDLDALLGHLGPEPLEPTFTPTLLAKRLKGRKRALKPLLLDQTFIAGVGNIYADEALFYAKLHPQKTADSLTPNDITRLHHAIQKVLQLGIDREGASISDYAKPDGTRGDMQNAVAVFRRTELPCHTCGNPIRRIVLGGRSTHFCAHCQQK